MKKQSNPPAPNYAKRPPMPPAPPIITSHTNNANDTVIMPKNLTAENGAKGLLSGEFKERIIVPCCDCHGEGIDDDGEYCLECGGAGSFSVVVSVNWTTIKEIYAMAVKHLST